MLTSVWIAKIRVINTRHSTQSFLPSHVWSPLWIYMKFYAQRKESKLTNFLFIIYCEYIHVNKGPICVFMKIISILFNKFYIMTTKIHCFWMAKFVKMRFEMKHLWFFVYNHLSLIFSVFVNLVRYLEWHPCPFWWGKWLLLVTCRQLYD